MSDPKPKNNLERLLASKKTGGGGTGAGGLSNLQQLMGGGGATTPTKENVANGKADGMSFLTLSTFFAAILNSMQTFAASRRPKLAIKNQLKLSVIFLYRNKLKNRSASFKMPKLHCQKINGENFPYT